MNHDSERKEIELSFKTLFSVLDQMIIIKVMLGYLVIFTLDFFLFSLPRKNVSSSYKTKVKIIEMKKKMVFEIVYLLLTVVSRASWSVQYGLNLSTFNCQ